MILLKGKTTIILISTNIFQRFFVLNGFKVFFLQMLLQLDLILHIPVTPSQLFF
jgi:hypothetical protein